MVKIFFTDEDSPLVGISSANDFCLPPHPDMSPCPSESVANEKLSAKGKDALDPTAVMALDKVELSVENVVSNSPAREVVDVRKNDGTCRSHDFPSGNFACGKIVHAEACGGTILRTVP